MPNERILVTGANGFIGRVLVRHLIQRGFRVRAVVRNTETIRSRGFPTVDTIAVGDVGNATENLIFLELGWIEKKENGWVTTDLGAKLCGQVEIGRDKKTFIKWPVGIEKSRVLTRAINEFLHPESKLKIEPDKEITKDAANFRSKFPANMRATDGHLVRSRGEMLIDNWLYMSGVAHAYERQLPIEEDVFCDFYIPSGDKVYIEYWGLESDARYLQRKIVKQDIYKKYNFNLIELQDKHIENLDDYLPKMLLKFNVVVN